MINGYLTRKELCKEYDKICDRKIWPAMNPINLVIKEFKERIIDVEIFEDKNDSSISKLFFILENDIYDSTNNYQIWIGDNNLLEFENKIYIRRNDDFVNCYSNVDKLVIGKLKILFTI